MYVLNEFYVKSVEGQKEAADEKSIINNKDGISEKTDNTGIYNALMCMIDRAYGSLETYG